MTLPPSTAEQLGLNPERLHRLDAWLEQQVGQNRVAGASVLVARHGATALFKSAGSARIAVDDASATPFERDTIVRLYSMTKPVTTVAAMMLYELGHFQLDDPVAWYLPEFADTPVWNGTEPAKGDSADAILQHVEPQITPFTVRQLMTHTAGLTYGFMQATPVDRYYREHDLNFPGSDTPLDELVSRLAKAPLQCQPGSQWNYSVSTDVLGRLVEVWSGQSLDEFFNQHIFGPLQMHDTGFHVEPDKQSRFADLMAPAAGGDLGGVSGSGAGSTPDEDPAKLSSARAAARGFAHARPVVMEPAAVSSFLEPPALLSGGGGLAGTIDDFARFAQMLLNGGELSDQRLLSSKSVEFMRQNHLPGKVDMAAMGQAVWSETSYQGVGFGLGFAVVLDPVDAQMITSPGEYHWGGAASTFFLIDPVEDMLVVFLTQLYPSSTYPIRRELRTALYQAIAD